MSMWMTLSITSKHLQVVPGRTKDRKNGRKATLIMQNERRPESSSWLTKQPTKANMYQDR